MGLSLFGVAHVLILAQGGQATLAGTVRDGVSGEPLTGALVVLTDLERSALTDAQGRYAFRLVPAGPQHVAVRRVGYRPRTLHAIVPRRGAVEITVALDALPIALRPVEAREAVPVPGLDRDPDARFPDRDLSLVAVRHHPLVAEPDAFLALGGGEVVLRPEAPGGIHVRGGASDQVAYFLDGIPVLSPYHAAGTFSAWNPDALSRVKLTTSAAAWGFPNALSGVVSGTTRAPGSRFGAWGSLSTTQARVAINGPLGGSGAGYAVSLRSGFPGFPRPKAEPSYLQGENGDWLAKFEGPVAGGRVRLLAYGSESELDAAAAVPSETAGAATSGALIRNGFRWRSRSLGAEWATTLGPAQLHVRAWSALGDAGAIWNADDSTAGRLTSERRDEGALAMVRVARSRHRTTFGARLERSRTWYERGPVSGPGPSWALGARTPLVALFVEHASPITASAELEMGVAGTWARGGVRADPRARLRLSPSARLSLSGELARVHQFAQSLRNPESVVGTVFPVDLYVGAGSAAVPVARSDQGALAAEYRPTAGVRLAVQAYARDFDGLVLVAPRDGAPFATSGFVVGGGRARGLAFEAAAHGARYGFLATYGLQRVRLAFEDSSYIPQHGAMHAFDVGATCYASATLSVRVGASGLIGRRVTALAEPFEWEACNALDQGCEFAGSPRGRREPLGATPLPAYLRVDAGLRKHWHVRAAGRDGSVAVFGTVTNLFGRGNVLTIAGDPATGARSAIEMRPRAPLLVGIDWRF